MEEVLAAHLTSEYDAKVPKAKETPYYFISQVYSELKAYKQLCGLFSNR